MSMADLFQKLGAPLTSTRWSWGAVSEEKDVYLRVWQDEFRTIDGKLTVRVIRHRAPENDSENLGYKERLDHVAQIRSGAKSFCILCVAKKPFSSPRVLASFDKEMIFVGGELIQDGEDCRLELVQRINVDELKRTLPQAPGGPS